METMSKKEITRRDFLSGMISLAGAGLSSLMKPGYSGKKKNHLDTNGSPNFIIFLVDKLRPDHLGIYGYPRQTSPNIDRLARQAIVFENAYAPCSWTYPSVVSLLTGLPQISHGANLLKKKIILPQPVAWLPVKFRENGYATVCFHTHPFLRKEVSNLHSAFAEYYDPSEKKRGEDRFSDYMYLDTLYPACEKWLEKNYRKPFFMYVHVIDVHGPYKKIKVLDEDKAELAELMKRKYPFPKAKERPDMFAASTEEPYPHKALFYDGHIFSMDKYFALLYDKLQSLGIGRNTFLILTSDHGEAFGEHNNWSHGMSVYEDQIRIPLIMYSHKFAMQKAGRMAGIVNTTGLLPTLFDMIGIKTEERAPGKSFFPLISSGAAGWKYNSLSDGCLKKVKTDPDSFMMDIDFKLITEKTSGIQYLFNLKEDPGELHPIYLNNGKAKRYSEIFKYLSQKRKEFFSSINPRGIMKKKIKGGNLKDLKTLGYL